jgi:cephalosporin-C deacetylase-like acetyl esterase
MYYREMPQEELKSYMSELSHPSDDFNYFLRQYVTGSPWARSRGEEDPSVWK